MGQGRIGGWRTGPAVGSTIIKESVIMRVGELVSGRGLPDMAQFFFWLAIILGILVLAGIAKAIWDRRDWGRDVFNRPTKKRRITWNEDRL